MKLASWNYRDPAEINECRGWDWTCGEYIGDEEEYCEYCDKQRVVDEQADALREARELQAGD